jgi:hypothetical protein
VSILLEHVAPSLVSLFHFNVDSGYNYRCIIIGGLYEMALI